MPDRQHFRRFATSVRKQLNRYRELENEEDLTSLQQEKVEQLVAAEIALREKIIEQGLTEEVYKHFVDHILLTKRNVLSASPFFREREAEFNEFISPALRARDYDTLAKYNFNWQFVKLFQQLPCSVGFEKEIEAIRKVREELAVSNLPLAVSRVQIFHGKMPKSHVELMDFVQIATEGLLNAIDKYVLPYTTSFRSVIIGRITGNFIREYSSTHLHFYPSDRRKLYRANAERRKVEEGDWETLAERVNAKLETLSVSPAELQELMAAASILSADSLPPSYDDDGEPEPLISTVPADDYWRPDVQYEELATVTDVKEAITKLTVYEQKLLSLKGVNFG